MRTALSLDAPASDAMDPALRSRPEAHRGRSPAQNDSAAGIPVPLRYRIGDRSCPRRAGVMPVRALFASLFFLAVSFSAEIPDIIYYNVRIVTMSTTQPQARAVAIKRNR